MRTPLSGWSAGGLGAACFDLSWPSRRTSLSLGALRGGDLGPRAARVRLLLLPEPPPLGSFPRATSSLSSSGAKLRGAWAAWVVFRPGVDLGGVGTLSPS